jgi:hypothetical protein
MALTAGYTRPDNSASTRGGDVVLQLNRCLGQASCAKQHFVDRNPQPIATVYCNCYFGPNDNLVPRLCCSPCAASPRSQLRSSWTGSTTRPGMMRPPPTSLCTAGPTSKCWTGSAPSRENAVQLDGEPSDACCLCQVSQPAHNFLCSR